MSIKGKDNKKQTEKGVKAIKKLKRKKDEKGLIKRKKKLI
jgi:hypothetical protein